MITCILLLPPPAHPYSLGSDVEQIGRQKFLYLFSEYINPRASSASSSFIQSPINRKNLGGGGARRVIKTPD